MFMSNPSKFYFYSSEPFSSYNFQKMKELFGLKADYLEELPIIKIEESPIADKYEKIIDSLIEELLIHC